jgi:hypothetical protein
MSQNYWITFHNNSNLPLQVVYKSSKYMYHTGPSSFFVGQRGMCVITVEDNNALFSGHNSEKTITWSVDDGRPDIVFHHYPYANSGLTNKKWKTGISGGATFAFCGGAPCAGGGKGSWVDSGADPILVDVYL